MKTWKKHHLRRNGLWSDKQQNRVVGDLLIIIIPENAYQVHKNKNVSYNWHCLSFFTYLFWSWILKLEASSSNLSDFSGHEEIQREWFCNSVYGHRKWRWLGVKFRGRDWNVPRIWINHCYYQCYSLWWFDNISASSSIMLQWWSSLDSMCASCWKCQVVEQDDWGLVELNSYFYNILTFIVIFIIPFFLQIFIIPASWSCLLGDFTSRWFYLHSRRRRVVYRQRDNEFMSGLTIHTLRSELYHHQTTIHSQ